MSMADISGKKVAIVVDDDFEQAEFTGPRDALKEAGAEVTVISVNGGEVHGMNHDEKADTFQTDAKIDDVDPDNFDALVLPGGAINADSLRMNEKTQQWTKQFLQAGKTVAAICHAPWVLASAGVAKGKKMTSWPTIQDDLKNAGAEWTDAEVCVDGNLITSRKPDDIPAFNREIINALGAAKGVKLWQSTAKQPKIKLAK
jgi:protease I